MSIFFHSKTNYNLQIFGLVEHLLYNGVISNVGKNDVLKMINFCKTYFTQCYYRLMELKANVEGGLRDADAGVIYDVLCLKTKYRIADVECAMLSKFVSICCEKRSTFKVCLNAVNAEGPKMSLNQIIQIIDENGEQCSKNKKFSCWKILKRRLPLGCRGKIDPEMECPNLEEDGVDKVAKIFEVNFIGSVWYTLSI